MKYFAITLCLLALALPVLAQPPVVSPLPPATSVVWDGGPISYMEWWGPGPGFPWAGYTGNPLVKVDATIYGWVNINLNSWHLSYTITGGLPGAEFVSPGNSIQHWGNGFGGYWLDMCMPAPLGSISDADWPNLKYVSGNYPLARPTAYWGLDAGSGVLWKGKADVGPTVSYGTGLQAYGLNWGSFSTNQMYNHTLYHKVVIDGNFRKGVYESMGYIGAMPEL